MYYTQGENMQTDYSNNIQFGMKFISPAKIKVKNGKYWKDLDVSFVKFETEKAADRKALRDVAKIWSNKNLSGAISEEAEILKDKSHIYALTLQKTDNGVILTDHILGLLTTDAIKKTGELIELFKIGTNPKFAYEQNRRTREVKHVAKNLINSFKEYAAKLSKTPVGVNYAEAEEVKFLQRTGVSIKNPDIVSQL